MGSLSASERAETIAGRLSEVQRRVADAALDCGRSPQDVTLVAVSKRHDEAAIRAAYAAGQRDFGENYVQEWQAKAAALADLGDLRWHFIGHLQRNKMRHVAGRMHLLHALGGSRGIKELCKRALRAGTPQAMLLQLNLSGETTKGGCTESEVSDLTRIALDAPGVRLQGLMTMPPPVADPELVRPIFRRLAELRARLRDELSEPEALPWLSMGMSQDFRVAIAEGATHVRVGTAIFGQRPAPPPGRG